MTTGKEFSRTLPLVVLTIVSILSAAEPHATPQKAEANQSAPNQSRLPQCKPKVRFRAEEPMPLCWIAKNVPSPLGASWKVGQSFFTKWLRRQA